MHRNTTEVVREGFVAKFGREPEGIWSAPGRVSLMGDHTDKEDGVTFGLAYEARSAVAVRRRDDSAITIHTDLTDEVVKTNLESLAPPTEHSWKDYPLGVIWALQKWIHEHPTDEETTHDEAATGLDLYLTTDVPIGGGLASSASLCAALTTALNELWSLGVDRYRLARFGHEVENVYIGASAGMSDHVTVLFGELNKNVFFDARGGDVSVIDVPDLAADRLAPIIIESGEAHRNWAGYVNDRHQACQRVAQTLGLQALREIDMDDLRKAAPKLDSTDYRRATYVVSEIQRVLDFTRLLRTEGALSVGHLFTESQLSLRDDFEVSTPRVDTICEVALASGAKGARMTGSGFGGCVFALMPMDHVPELRERLAETFREQGWEGLEIYEAHPVEGARREA